MNTMNDSTALVTGANKGIGQEIARQLAAAGLTVYVGSRDAGRGQRAVEEIGGNARLLIRAPGQGCTSKLDCRLTEECK